jgi:adenine/guanine phosphoribosyltransferase-like PRPP-binding protein
VTGRTGSGKSNVDRAPGDAAARSLARHLCTSYTEADVVVVVVVAAVAVAVAVAVAKMLQVLRSGDGPLPIRLV